MERHPRRDQRGPSSFTIAVVGVATVTTCTAVWDARMWREVSLEAAVQTLSLPEIDSVQQVAQRRLAAMAIDAIAALRQDAARDDDRGAAARLLLSRISETLTR